MAEKLLGTFCLELVRLNGGGLNTLRINFLIFFPM